MQERVKVLSKFVAVLDLDGVFCQAVDYTDDPDYLNRRKDNQIDNLLSFLRDNDFKIIIHTARLSIDREVTEKWLKINGIEYDELLFDKPRGDVYIDDRAVNVKELQILLNGVKSLVGGV